MNAEKLRDLQIAPGEKRRPQRPFWTILIAVAALTIIAALMARPWDREESRVVKKDAQQLAASSSSAPPAAPSPPSAAPETTGGSVLTVSGYIINRERIEISPRFLGVVKWIGVKKGDPVTNGQVVVLLDDAEYQARVNEAIGRRENARATAAQAELDFARVSELLKTDIESKKSFDDARLQVDGSRAALKASEGAYELAQTYLDWCTIRSPIDGVVLEKLVDPNELVVPQSFGGGRGPSTALIAVADPKDLQVEIDVNEADLSKISLSQKCRVSPEAYPDKNYEGVVVEIAPEADRAKGTLQIKVQILKPDRFLTPQLSAKVEFLK